jgi:hypothetical protein
MTNARKQQFDLRIVAFDGQRYALYLSLYIRRHDIYTTAGHVDGRNFFRHSHHASGQTHLRVGDQIIAHERSQMPSSINGKARVAIVSQSFNGLEWNYKPRKETKARRNIVIDTRIVNVPQFTVEIWAIEPKQSNVDVVISELRAYKILICEHITSTTPEFVVVVWTLSPQHGAHSSRSCRPCLQIDRPTCVR